MPPLQNTAHLTPQTTLAPGLQGLGSLPIRSGTLAKHRQGLSIGCATAGTIPAPDRAIGAITTADLNRFFEWMEKEHDVPCSPKTLARRITSTKSLFRWLHQFGVLTIDPAEKVAQRSAISPLPAGVDRG